MRAAFRPARRRGPRRARAGPQPDDLLFGGDDLGTLSFRYGPDENFLSDHPDEAP